MRELAARAAGGATTADVRAELNELQSRSLLFQLRANCLGYCQIVHSHHGHEDALLFPAVRRTAPHLSKTVDRLEADHRVVSALLDRVEELADGLDDQPTRQALVVALPGSRPTCSNTSHSRGVDRARPELMGALAVNTRPVMRTRRHGSAP